MSVPPTYGYALIVIWTALLLLAFALGRLVGGRRAGRNMLRVHRLLAQYELLAAYTRLRLLPYLQLSDAKTIPLVTAGLLRNVDEVRGYISHADESKAFDLIQWAYKEATTPNDTALLTQLPVWKELEDM